MLKFTVLLMLAACIPCFADEITYTAATTQYTDGDVPYLPQDYGFVALPGFNPSLGTLEAASLVSTFSLTGMKIEVGTDTQNASFSVVYTPSLSVSGPDPYTPPFPLLFASGSVAVGTLNLTASEAGVTSGLGVHCCDQPFGDYIADVGVSGPAATEDYEFSDLDPFTSNDQLAFVYPGQIGGCLDIEISGTAPAGCDYWTGNFTVTESITYTYDTEPSSVILLSTVLFVMAFVARKRIAQGL